MNKPTLEERIRQLEDEIARMKRENEDALGNLDTGNFGSNLNNRLNTMQTKTKILTDAVSVDGTTVTITARKVIFKTAEKRAGEDNELGYFELKNGVGELHVRRVYNSLD